MLQHAYELKDVDTELTEKEAQIVKAMFAKIPTDRIFGSLSGISKMKFEGGLKFILHQLGKPIAINILLTQEKGGPEWRSMFRADFKNYGTLFGPFDPSSFIFLWNYRQRVVEDITIGLHAFVNETIVLNAAKQPEIYRLDGDMFVKNTLIPIDEKEINLPEFMKIKDN